MPAEDTVVCERVLPVPLRLAVSVVAQFIDIVWLTRLQTTRIVVAVEVVALLVCEARREVKAAHRLHDVEECRRRERRRVPVVVGGTKRAERVDGIAVYVGVVVSVLGYVVGRRRYGAHVVALRVAWEHVAGHLQCREYDTRLCTRGVGVACLHVAPAQVLTYAHVLAQLPHGVEACYDLAAVCIDERTLVVVVLYGQTVGELVIASRHSYVVTLERTRAEHGVYPVGIGVAIYRVLAYALPSHGRLPPRAALRTRISSSHESDCGRLVAVDAPNTPLYSTDGLPADACLVVTSITPAEPA